MNAWKVAAELHVSKNMMFGSNSPSGMVKVAFHWSSGLMGMLLYSHCKSNLVKINDPHNLLTRLEMRGRG